MRKLALTLCFLPGLAWAQTIAPGGGGGSGSFPPAGCVTSNGVIFNSGTPCDTGLTYTGLSGGASVTIAAGTLTSNSNALSITQTWNNGATTFDAPLFMSITNTASNAASKLFDLQVGGAGVFQVFGSGKTWIDVGASETNTRAGGLTVSSTPGAYTPGSDPGDSNRGLSVAGRSASGSTAIVLGLNNSQLGWNWDFIAYNNSGQLLDINSSAGGYHTVATFNPTANSLKMSGLFIGGPGTAIASTSNFFSSNNSNLNAVEIANISSTGYSAIQVDSSAGVEQTAWGWGNSGTAATFAGTAYWEGSGPGSGNSLSFIIASTTGRTAEFSTHGFDIYANSGSINTAYGSNTFSVDRATGSQKILSVGTTTTLNGGINNSVTSLTLASGTNFPIMGTLIIDSEFITYSAIAANVVTVTARGAFGSTAASHSNGATVYFATFIDAASASASPSLLLGSGTQNWSTGHLWPTVDNTYNLGDPAGNFRWGQGRFAGTVSAGALTSGGSIQTGAASALGWNGRTEMTSAADGQIAVKNNSGGTSLFDYGASAATTLTVVGTLNVSAIANAATTSALCYNTGTGLITYDGTVGTCTVSAMRFKDGIHNATLNLAAFAYVPLPTWYYRQDSGFYEGGRNRIGFIAEDIEQMDSRCAVYGEDGKLMNYDDRCILVYLKAANDNLAARVEYLERRIAR